MRQRPPVLERLPDEDLTDLERALEAIARPGGDRNGYTVPGRAVDGQATTVTRTRIPWEARAGVRSLELTRELTTTGARQSRMGNGGGGASAPAHERAVPYVATALDLAVELHAVVADLAAALLRADARDHVDRPRPVSLHAEDLAAWLLEHLEDLAGHPGVVGQHLPELRRLVGKARAAVDRRADRWYAGPCHVALRDDEGSLVIVNGAQARCPEDLYVRPHVAVAICRACGAEHHVDDRRAELVRQAYERLETATVISRALAGLLGRPVPAATIRQWKRRGRLIARGHDAKGDPFYRVGDVVDLVNDDAARRSRVRVAGSNRKPRP